MANLHPRTLAAIAEGPHKTHLIGEMHRVEETYAQFARRIALIEQEECANDVPANWCDPLLTGKDAPNYDNCQHIEWLLNKLRDAIRRRGKP